MDALARRIGADNQIPFLHVNQGGTYRFDAARRLRPVAVEHTNLKARARHERNPPLADESGTYYSNCAHDRHFSRRLLCVVTRALRPPIPAIQPQRQRFTAAATPRRTRVSPHNLTS